MGCLGPVYAVQRLQAGERMSEQVVAQPAPTFAQPVAPATTTTVDESPTIKQMREQIKAQEQRAKAAEDARDALLSEKTAQERAKLDEVEKLRLDVNDLSAKAQEAEKLRQAMEANENRWKSQYETALGKLPESVRASAEAIANLGNSFAEKFDALTNFTNALTAATPIKVGTQTNVGLPGNVTVSNAPEPPRPFNEWGNYDFTQEALKASADPERMARLRNTVAAPKE